MQTQDLQQSIRILLEFLSFSLSRSLGVNGPLRVCKALPMCQLHVRLFGGVIVVGFGELLGDD